jgi:hypothetical protein
MLSALNAKLVCHRAQLLFRQSNFEDRAFARARDTVPTCRPDPNLRSGESTTSGAETYRVVGSQLGVAHVHGMTEM